MESQLAKTVLAIVVSEKLAAADTRVEAALETLRRSIDEATADEVKKALYAE